LPAKTSSHSCGVFEAEALIRALEQRTRSSAAVELRAALHMGPGAGSQTEGVIQVIAETEPL
jgi:hypothetical protein